MERIKKKRVIETAAAQTAYTSTNYLPLYSFTNIPIHTQTHTCAYISTKTFIGTVYCRLLLLLQCNVSFATIAGSSLMIAASCLYEFVQH